MYETKCPEQNPASNKIFNNQMIIQEVQVESRYRYDMKCPKHNRSGDTVYGTKWFGIKYEMSNGTTCFVSANSTVIIT